MYIDASNLPPPFQVKLSTLFITAAMRLTSLRFVLLLNVATGIALNRNNPYGGRQPSTDGVCGVLGSVDRGYCDPNVNPNYRCCGPNFRCGGSGQDLQISSRAFWTILRPETGKGSSCCKKDCHEGDGICEPDVHGFFFGELCGVIDGINRGRCNPEIAVGYLCCGAENTCGE